MNSIYRKSGEWIDEQFLPEAIDYCEVEITPRQLAMVGIDYLDVGWEAKEKEESKDFSDTIKVDKLLENKNQIDKLAEHAEVLNKFLFSEDEQLPVMMVEKIHDEADAKERRVKYVPISNKQKQLMELGFLLPLSEEYTPEATGHAAFWDSRYTTRTFLSYDECSPEQQKQLKSYKEQIEKIRRSENPKYDQKGKVSIPRYGERKEYTLRRIGSGKVITSGYIESYEIDITLRDLAKAGILYTDLPLPWKSFEQIKAEEDLLKSGVIPSKGREDDEITK